MDIEGTDGELRPGEDDPTDGSDASDGSDHTWTRRGLIAGVAAAGAGAAVGMVGGSAVAGVLWRVSRSFISRRCSPVGVARSLSPRRHGAACAHGEELGHRCP